MVGVQVSTEFNSVRLAYTSIPLGAFLRVGIKGCLTRERRRIHETDYAFNMDLGYVGLLLEPPGTASSPPVFLGGSLYCNTLHVIRIRIHTSEVSWQSIVQIQYGGRKVKRMILPYGVGYRQQG